MGKSEFPRKCMETFTLVFLGMWGAHSWAVPGICSSIVQFSEWLGTLVMVRSESLHTDMLAGTFKHRASELHDAAASLAYGEPGLCLGPDNALQG